MMDGPVWLHGQLAGIVCCEQTGGPRVWTLEEEEFVVGVKRAVNSVSATRRLWAMHRAAIRTIRLWRTIALTVSRAC